jgi:spore germination cell wall hydrolase CwlJ-like protein
MKMQISAIASSAWTALRRWYRDLERLVARSSWTHRAVAGGAILGVFAFVGLLVLQTGLARPAAAEGQRPVQPISNLEPDLQALDFTLSPDALRAISMDEARAFNASLPFSSLPILSARPFIMAPDRPFEYARALDCLTAAVYYEAAAETAAGQAGVAQVVINRMRHPAYPKTICGVVFEGHERTTGCQFSFTCDGAMARVPSTAGWARARGAAAAALNGAVAGEVGMATHYHTDWVAPYWAERLVKIRQIGTHIFYRWTGGWGLPPAFNGAHAGAEPEVAKMAALATYADEIPEPVLEMASIEFTPAPAIVLSRSPEPEIEMPAAVTGGEEVAGGAAIETAEAAAAPAPVLANPLVSPGPAAPQRRARIATPR